MSDISIESATGTLPSVQKTDVSRAAREAGKAEATKDEASRSVRSVSVEQNRRMLNECRTDDLVRSL